MIMKFQFELEKSDLRSKARAGTFRTSHGEVKTPVFMPVGTFASVKTLGSEDLEDLGAQIILGNTYHLMLRPGAEVFDQFGGIHNLIKWKKPVLTDSGGYQLFCLPKRRTISEKGATFHSYTDGTYHLLSPETSIAMQQSIGSDIMMVLDECVPSTADDQEIKRAMNLTHRWALRSLRARTNSHQALFAIVQGGTNLSFRKESADFLTQHDFDGFAVGGLAVGESKNEREDTADFATDLLPTNKPRYLMGVGTPIDLLEGVKRGIDMFDCILPTKFAQQGIAFTSHGKLGTTRQKYRFEDRALDPNCKCSTCRTYSLAYVHHLMKCQEPLGWRLLVIHNIHYYLGLMEKARAAILEDRYLEFYKETLDAIGVSDTGTVNGVAR